MHAVHFSNDNDSIDYDFFNNEEGQIRMCSNGNHNDSSKIITTAVIETFPQDITNNISCPKEETPKQILINPDLRVLDVGNNVPKKSCPSNKTKFIDKSLLNCLAYEDETLEIKCSDSLKFEDKNLSDNSLSDSTLTTITSDVTSISPCSLVSSFSFEECEDSYASHNTVFSDKAQPNITNDINSQENSLEEMLSKSHKVSLSDNEDKYELNVNNSRPTITDSGRFLRLKDTESYTKHEHDNISALEEELGSISITNQSSTSSNILKSPICRRPNKHKPRKKETNLTFNREELMKIERDNLILLKKIMTHSKPRTISLNYPFTHKKTSAAINRARQQKKIEQDNYVLYSKISAVGKMKKVF